MSELRVCIFCDLGDNIPERKVASTLLNLAEVRRLGNDGEAIMVRAYSMSQITLKLKLERGLIRSSQRHGRTLLGFDVLGFKDWARLKLGTLDLSLSLK